MPGKKVKIAEKQRDHAWIKREDIDERLDGTTMLLGNVQARLITASATTISLKSKTFLSLYGNCTLHSQITAPPTANIDDGLPTAAIVPLM